MVDETRYLEDGTYIEIKMKCGSVFPANEPGAVADGFYIVESDDKKYNNFCLKCKAIMKNLTG